MLCNIVKSGDTDSLEVISSRLQFNDLINEFSEFDGIDNVLEFIEYCNILIENDSKIIIKITESGLCPLNSEPNILSAVRILLNNNIVKIQDIYSIEKVNSNSLSEDIQNQNYHSVRFSKKSSGEQCIFLLLLGVASSIEDNSLICIDEPELSLHPSWQLSFMEIIMDSFSDFKGCHFVISTHSPQILANVSGSNCEILNLETGDLTKSKNYHHRSADYQLAMLFRSPGFKNEYLINETLDILNQLAKPQSESPETLIELKRRAHLMSELKEFLSPDDPVSSLINTIESALEVIVREC
ncbi:AAA family ATPase [Vibrio cholerae]|uniref:AAA family ATPase n=1 Tax=Vibrio cholerae TaxID=666 RepID=UPI00165E09A6|nr:AAA family ATPase [Vibrio cholerae]